MFGYKVGIISHQDHYEHDGEEWGEWSSAHSHRMGDVTKNPEYPDVTSILDIEVGESCIVVWAIWSSGDSFGCASGGCSEAIGIFTDINSATALVNYINSKDWNKDHIMDFVTPDMQEFKQEWVGWSGYFESLDSVEASVVVMKY